MSFSKNLIYLCDMEKDNKVRFWGKLDKIINNRQHENAQEKIDAKNI